MLHIATWHEDALPHGAGPHCVLKAERLVDIQDTTDGRQRSTADCIVKMNDSLLKGKGDVLFVHSAASLPAAPDSARTSCDDGMSCCVVYCTALCTAEQS